MVQLALNTLYLLVSLRKFRSEYDFIENQDFICVSHKNETQRADGQIGVDKFKSILENE